MNYVVGVDVGGTKILTMLADPLGNVLAEVTVPTMADEGAEGVMERVVQTVTAVQQQIGVRGGLLAVAVGVPGPVDVANGWVYFCPNLPWTNLALKQILENKLQVPVLVENDANAAAFGEHVYGAGVGQRDMIYVTVSTGIGGGIITNGQIYHGASDNAGEIGHMTIMPDGPLCNCGNTGCLESLASGTAMANAARELVLQGRGERVLRAAGGQLGTVDAQAVVAAAQEGDHEAKAIVAGAARALGIGIANLINIINPGLVVLGGGVMNSKEMFWPVMQREIESRALQAPLARMKIVPARLGAKAGARGLIALALKCYRN
ncbi:ROK family protein [Peptococcaceae bacterium 1198_IL3148]